MSAESDEPHATDQSQWLVFVYRLPATPAERIGVYQDLKGLGALFFQRGTCILPAGATHHEGLQQIAERVLQLGGDSLLFEALRVSLADGAKIVQGFRAARNRDYSDIIGSCERKLLWAADPEHALHTYTERRARDMTTALNELRGRYNAIAERDWFEADLRERAADTLRASEDALATFKAKAKHRKAGRKLVPGTLKQGPRRTPRIPANWLNNSTGFVGTWKLPRLRYYRQRAGQSQRALAISAGLSHPTVASLERGVTQAVPSTVLKLAAALAVEPYHLLDQNEAQRAIGQSVGVRTTPGVPLSSLQRDHLALPYLGFRRAQAGLSAEELGQRSGVTALTIAAIERGRESARLSTAVKLAQALHVEVVDLMEKEPNVSRLRYARYRAGATIVDLAAQSGVTRKAILQIERGRPAKLTTLAKLADALHIDLNELLDEPPEPGRKLVRINPVSHSPTQSTSSQAEQMSNQEALPRKGSLAGRREADG